MPNPTIILAVTGASGAIYALRTAMALLDAGCRIELIVSNMGRAVLAEELGLSPEEKFSEQILEQQGGDASSDRIIEFDVDRLNSPPASGTHAAAGMAVVPCSMKTLASIACGLSRNLIERAADVTLKERRPLVLVPRECPMNLIHLRNMVSAAESGAVIAPASPAFYHGPKDLTDLADFIAGRVLWLLGIEHSRIKSWGEETNQQ